MYTVRIGTAGWDIPRTHRETMEDSGSYLERYARCFNAVEVNSSFYRTHRIETYERWAKSVPAAFKFSVKVPKVITHESALRGCRSEIEDFARQVTGLGAKLSVLLVQLPPSLEYEWRPARNFFARLSGETPAQIVCEPRHPSWFAPSVDKCLARWQISRVAADPAPAGGATPAGDASIAYVRLHGSPRIYYSSYTPEFLSSLHERLRTHRRAGQQVWCIFDNTAAFAAWDNARALQALARNRSPAGFTSRPGAPTGLGIRSESCCIGRETRGRNTPRC